MLTMQEDVSFMTPSWQLRFPHYMEPETCHNFQVSACRTSVNVKRTHVMLDYVYT